MKEKIASVIGEKMLLLCEFFDIDIYALVILTIIACCYLLAILPEIKQENLIRLRTRLTRIGVVIAKLFLFIAELVWNYACIPVYKVFKKRISKSSK